VAGTRSVAALLAALAERAPDAKAAAWDPVGLQLGDPSAPVRRAAVCHEATEAIVARLESDPVELLVTYHPLLFEPLRRLVAGANPGGRALRLARAGVAVGVVHTSFDVAPGGASDALAQALGLSEVRGFAPLRGPDSVRLVTFVPVGAADAVLDAVAGAGAGRVGNYTHCSFRSEGVGTFFAARGTAPVAGEGGKLNREPELRLEFVAPRSREDEVVAALIAAHPYEEPAYDVLDRRGDAALIGRVGAPGPGTTLGMLAERVAGALDCAAPRVAGDRTRELHRVAVLPGSGADFTGAAASAGADALVTGDLGHHAAREALDRGLSLIDPGHAATERPGLARLRDWVGSLGIETVDLAGLDPDPWQT
jgi:dinuclear metal center YbgI/SA1388 family protein